jgi:Na+/H+ antiporter NhaD/arsenite permease-like protein
MNALSEIGGQSSLVLVWLMVLADLARRHGLFGEAVIISARHQRYEAGDATRKVLIGLVIVAATVAALAREKLVSWRIRCQLSGGT